MIELPANDEIVEEYLSEHPTVQSSREIVRRIAERRSTSEAKIRSILVAAGVYLAQPRRAAAATIE